MKNLKSFDTFINEGLEPIDDEIKLNTDFENKLSIEDYIKILKDNVKISISKSEVMKLNLFFGIWKKSNEGVYVFNKTTSGFGKPTKILSGYIEKLTDKDKNSTFVVHLDYTLKTLDQKGYDGILLKFNTLSEIFKFINIL